MRPFAADETDPVRQRTIVARIHDRSVGLSRLTDQLLNHALIIHRADAVPRQSVDLRTTAMRTVEEHDTLITQKPSDLQLDLLETPVVVRGDPLSLIEACKNLVNNGFRYGAAPVIIQVSVHSEPPHRLARLSVQDHGDGMAEHLWSEAGMRFARQGDARPICAGLGLSIVQAVAIAHGGRMSVGRNAAGRFEVALLLPLHEVQVLPQADCQAGFPDERQGGRHEASRGETQLAVSISIAGAVAGEMHAAAYSGSAAAR